MSTYDDLAALFTYPDAEGLPRVRAAAAKLTGLGPFAERIQADTPEEHEEHFTRSFDINPVTSLEVGWHLFGEDYSRGAFLVRMRAAMRDCELPEIRELPDHLTNVLMVIGRLEKRAADDLARGFALPAIAKMLKAFENKEDDYQGTLEAVQRFLRTCHGRETEPGEIQAQPYSSPCGTCVPFLGEEVRGE